MKTYIFTVEELVILRHAMAAMKYELRYPVDAEVSENHEIIFAIAVNLHQQFKDDIQKM